jgi:DNA (cytosine-5)-methyltransferase 1
MQRAWRQSEPVAGPYALVDQLGQAAIAMTHVFTSADREEVINVVLATCADSSGNIVSKDKLTKNAPAILSGLVLGSWFNGLTWAADEPARRDLAIIVTA